MQVEPVLGRTFLREEDRPVFGPVVMTLDSSRPAIGQDHLQ
jgi:hypothetical protein